MVLSLNFLYKRSLISPVPPAKSNITEGFELSIFCIRSFFHNLCKPKLIKSFIRSYWFDTLLNKLFTNSFLVLISTIFFPNFTLFILYSF